MGTHSSARHISIGVLATLLTASVTVPGLGDDKLQAEKTDELAKRAGEQFLKVLVAEDADATMKLVDVPFCFFRETIANREELKKKFTQMFKREDFQEWKFTLDEMHPYGKIPDNFWKKKHKETLDTFFKNDDRILIYTFTPNERDDRFGLAVRIKDGKGRIVGMPPK